MVIPYHVFVVFPHHSLVTLAFYLHIAQWEFQDPKMEVPYKAIFCGDIHLHRPNK